MIVFILNCPVRRSVLANEVIYQHATSRQGRLDILINDRNVHGGVTLGTAHKQCKHLVSATRHGCFGMQERKQGKVEYQTIDLIQYSLKSLHGRILIRQLKPPIIYTIIVLLGNRKCTHLEHISLKKAPVKKSSRYKECGLK